MSDDVNNGINSGIALQYLNYIEPYVREIEGQRREIASLKKLIIQAAPYVEYAVRYSTPLSQKLSEEWLEKTQERREK
jgi:hypothetical protein